MEKSIEDFAPLKDFAYWRRAIRNSKTRVDLNSVGKELSQFQERSGLPGVNPMVTDAQQETLRKLLAERMNEIEAKRERQPSPIFPSPPDQIKATPTRKAKFPFCMFRSDVTSVRPIS